MFFGGITPLDDHRRLLVAEKRPESPPLGSHAYRIEDDIGVYGYSSYGLSIPLRLSGSSWHHRYNRKTWIIDKMISKKEHDVDVFDPVTHGYPA